MFNICNICDTALIKSLNQFLPNTQPNVLSNFVDSLSDSRLVGRVEDIDLSFHIAARKKKV